MIDPFILGTIIILVSSTMIYDHCTYNSPQARVARYNLEQSVEESIKAKIDLKASEAKYNFEVVMEIQEKEKMKFEAENEKEKMILESQHEREMVLIKGLTQKVESSLVPYDVNQMTTLHEQNNLVLKTLGQQLEQTSHINLEILKTLEKIHNRMDKFEERVYDNSCS
jgi:hypothetical protein